MADGSDDSVPRTRGRRTRSASHGGRSAFCNFVRRSEIAPRLPAPSEARTLQFRRMAIGGDDSVIPLVSRGTDTHPNQSRNSGKCDIFKHSRLITLILKTNYETPPSKRNHRVEKRLGFSAGTHIGTRRNASAGCPVGTRGRSPWRRRGRSSTRPSTPRPRPSTARARARTGTGTLRARRSPAFGTVSRRMSARRGRGRTRVWGTARSSWTRTTWRRCADKGSRATPS